MNIRIRSIFAIFLTALLIICFSIMAGIITVRGVIEKSQETDLALMSDIADHFISSEIKALKIKAAAASEILSLSDYSEWPDVIADIEKNHHEFFGISVLSEGSDLLASAGKFPANKELLNHTFIKQVFQGKTAISSVIQETQAAVIYLAAPLKNDSILVFTLPCLYFSDLLSKFLIWETGHIFMDDVHGRLIANPRPSWVE